MIRQRLIHEKFLYISLRLSTIDGNFEQIIYASIYLRFDRITSSSKFRSQLSLSLMNTAVCQVIFTFLIFMIFWLHKNVMNTHTQLSFVRSHGIFLPSQPPKIDYILYTSYEMTAIYSTRQCNKICFRIWTRMFMFVLVNSSFNFYIVCLCPGRRSYYVFNTYPLVTLWRVQRSIPRRN